MTRRTFRHNYEMSAKVGPELCDRCGVFGIRHVVHVWPDLFSSWSTYVCDVCLADYFRQLRAGQLEYRVGDVPDPATSNGGVDQVDR